MALRTLIGRAILWFTDPVFMARRAATDARRGAVLGLGAGFSTVGDGYAGIEILLPPGGHCVTHRWRRLTEQTVSDWDRVAREREQETEAFRAMKSQPNQPTVQWTDEDVRRWCVETVLNHYGKQISIDASLIPVIGLLEQYVRPAKPAAEPVGWEAEDRLRIERTIGLPEGTLRTDAEEIAAILEYGRVLSIGIMLGLRLDKLCARAGVPNPAKTGAYYRGVAGGNYHERLLDLPEGSLPTDAAKIAAYEERQRAGALGPMGTHWLNRLRDRAGNAT
jgi:hypothetical protein